MPGEWRSWEIGTANTAKRREIVERGGGEEEKISRREGGRQTAGAEDVRLYEGWRTRGWNPRSNRLVFKRFVKKSWTRFTLDYSPGAGVKSRNEMTIDIDGSEQVEIIGNG